MGAGGSAAGAVVGEPAAVDVLEEPLHGGAAREAGGVGLEQRDPVADFKPFLGRRGARGSGTVGHVAASVRGIEILTVLSRVSSESWDKIVQFEGRWGVLETLPTCNIFLT